MVNLRSLSLLALGALATACRHREDVRPPAPLVAPTPSPSESLAELRWVLGGSRLLVDNQWLLDPEGGGYTALPYTTSRPVEGGGTEQLGISLSRGGARIVVWDSRQFSFGPVDSAPRGPFSLPPLPQDAPRQARLLFWDDQEQLWLYQHRLEAEASPTCDVFDSATGAWRPAGGCPEGDFVELTQVDPGPDQWMTLFSEAEGMRSVRLTHSGAAVLGFEFSPPGDVQTQFSRDGTRLELTTPCALEQEERPCRDVEDETPWRRYSWRLQERRLVLEQEGLPPHVTPSPEGGRLAWPEPGRVCIGEAARIGAARCHALPTPRHAQSTAWQE
ncbi:hypothetical protein [Cystobacter fuscus]|uniref:hypothetical protein n=1 Tax=Cystobacter fuscus TaxID=43 RepID=UPI002B2D892F|nr:hypothetical protein F0U63_29360 [Cystobacter fuscus]